MYKVEYLVIMKSNGSFCNDLDSFNNLLKVNSQIKIEDESLIFNEKKFNYINKTNTVKDKDQHYIKLLIGSESHDDISDFQNLLKNIREVIFKAEAQINIIWDDISNYYSIQAYPEINKIENLLRKLITTFMLINLGIEWSKEATPAELKTPNKRGGNKENPNSNFLHDTDFIQLADFLFKPYSNKDVSLLFKDLKKIKSVDELEIESLKEYIPRSNWDRYFKEFVDYEGENLNKNWTILYDYRCLVAHNRILSKYDFEKIIELVNNLEEKFLKAIDNIDGIIVPKSEQNIVIENVIINHNEKLQEFFKFWNSIVDSLEKLYTKEIGSLIPGYRIRNLVDALVDKKILNEVFSIQITEIGMFYNKIIENSDEINESSISEMTRIIKDFYLVEIVWEKIFNELD